MTLRDLLGLRPKAADAAALHASLTATQAALAAARSTVVSLEGERGAILLDGTPAEAEAHERKLADAKAEAERLAAMAAALPARIADAEARERNADLDRIAERAEADAGAGALLVPEIVASLARVAELIEQHDALAERVVNANTALRAAGRERVQLATRRVWPHDAAAGLVVSSLAPHLVLPGPRGACPTIAAWRAEIARATG